MNALTFNAVSFNPVTSINDGQVWLTSAELAQALGYARADKVTQIYNRKSDEFTANMTQVIDIPDNLNLRVSEDVQNLTRKMRVFSLRGCHLIAMFARTEIAKDFRKWVLDILEKEIGHSTIINEQQAHAILQLVRSRCKNDGAKYQTLYCALQDKFEITSYKLLPMSCFSEAMEFLVNFELPNKEQPKTETLDPNISYFLTVEQVREFDYRMLVLFDLARLMNDDSHVASMFKKHARGLHNFVISARQWKGKQDKLPIDYDVIPPICV